MTSKYIRLGFLGLVLGLGILGGLALFFKETPKNYVKTETPFSFPDLGGGFDLVDQFGDRRQSQDFKGKFMLLYFGYSFCPDICPLGLQNITGALTQLGRDIDEVTPIFITIDPERDTVDHLKIYATNWHSSLIFLTGSPQQILPVLKSYKVYAAKVTPKGTKADYMMDHSTLVYLMNRDGQFIDSFPHTTPPEDIVKILNRHLLANPSALKK